MKIAFSSRPYSGSHPRPTPEVSIDPVMGSLIVAVPWGSRSAARKVIERMTEYLSFASQDNEATSPLPRLSCLSTAANNLRTATMLANEMLYREDNREEYHSGVEIFAATLSHNELSWIQVGGPHLLLSRGSNPLLPIGSSVDLAFDLGRNQETLPALPANLLGLDSQLNVTINSFRARPGDKLLMVSHSRPPELLYSCKSEDIETDRLVRTLAQTDAGTAFWLGLLSIEADGHENTTDLSAA